MASQPTLHALSTALQILHLDLEPLRIASNIPSKDAFRMRLPETINVFKMLITSTRASDITAWRGDSPISFSVDFLRDSTPERLRLLAWYHFARSAPLLQTFWTIPVERLERLVDRFQHLAAFDAQPVQINTLEDIRGAEELVDLPQALDCQWYLPSEFIPPAADCAPGLFTLLKALSVQCLARLSADRRTLHASFQHAAPTTVFTIPARGQYGTTTVVVQHGAVIALHAPYGMNHMLRTRERQRQWQPESMRYPDFDWGPHPLPPHDDAAWDPESPLLPRPPLHVTNLTRRAHVWKRMLGSYVGTAAGMLIYGHACFPLKSIPVVGFERPNSIKTKTPEAAAFIDSILAKYAAAGIIAYCPPQFKPPCVSPLSVVPKKTAPWFRLVVDLRLANLYQEDWHITMNTLAQASHIFCPGAYVFTRDVEAAFLITGFGACRPGLHRLPGSTKRRYQIGCTPSNCTGTCSKSLLGFKWRNQYWRYECPAFGAKQSGSLLSVLLEPYLRRLRSKGVAILCWVDDIACVVAPLPEHRHDASQCGGHERCSKCHATWQRAVQIEKEVDAEMEALGLFTNLKRTAPALFGEFLGLGYDCRSCTFVLSYEKAESLAAKAAELAATTVTTPRLLAKFRGKISWYSPCIQGVRLLTRHINAAIGAPETPAAWDAEITNPATARREFTYLASNLPAMAEKSRPMWELSGDQAIRAYRRGHSAIDAMIITDASVHGWGAILRLRVDGIEHVFSTVGHWAPDNTLEQAHRESNATPLALRAFSHLLPGRSLVHISDCACVVAAQTAGSAKSAILQENATEVYLEANRVGYNLISGWMSGVDMVTEGVDHLSREGAFDRHDVRLSDDQWHQVQTIALENGWQIGLDLFADRHSARAPAYWAPQPCGAAEGVDALVSPSWRFAMCTTCHHECERAVLLFPPAPLLNKAVAKAKADQAYGIAVVPFMPGALWTPVLKQASISTHPVNSAEFQRGAHVEHAVYAPSRAWLLVAFDFRQPDDSDGGSCPCRLPTVAPIRVPLHGARADDELRRARSLLALKLATAPDECYDISDAASSQAAAAVADQ